MKFHVYDTVSEFHMGNQQSENGHSINQVEFTRLQVYCEEMIVMTIPKMMKANQSINHQQIALQYKNVYKIHSTFTILTRTYTGKYNF